MSGDRATAPAALGIDMGSTTAKVIGVDRAGEIVHRQLEDTAPRMQAQAARLVADGWALGGGAQVPVVATGYGRKLVREAVRKVTEISCHARGVYRALGHGGTLIDIGGQDSKVIAIGEDGTVRNFAMNDKCAAGTGRFLEVVARRLQLSLDELGAAALRAEGEVSISTTCAVFAESEIVSLLAREEPLDHIARGLFRALCRRVAAMARSTGATPPILLSGGVALGTAVSHILGEELSEVVKTAAEPQFMGAYGAALFALGQV